MGLLQPRNSLKKPSRRRIIYFWLIFSSIICASVYAASPRFAFILENIHHPAFNIRSIEVKSADAHSPGLEVNLSELVVKEWRWPNLRLFCDRFEITRQSIDCNTGTLHIDEKSLPVSFQLSLQRKQLILVIEPGSKEKWQLTVDWHAEKWHGLLKITNGRGELLTGLLPQKEDWPQLHRARINGTINLQGHEALISELSLKLEITELSFSDPSGLQAGEQIHLRLSANAQRKQAGWQWQSQVAWLGGEVFWQPFYFTGEGHQLVVNGRSSEKYISVDQSVLNLSGIGQVNFSGGIDLSTQTVQQAWLSAENLKLSALFANIVRPFALETTWAEIDADGRASVTWYYQDKASQSLVIDLQDVSLTDTHDRFSLKGLDAHVPWRSEEKSTGVIRFESGEILRIPLGSAQISFETSGKRFGVPYMEIPMLDGKVIIENFTAALQTSGWQWQFNGRLFPISMEKLTDALQIQPMFGTLSGIVPMMSYADSTMTMEGVLVFNVFDGVAVARNLVLTDPLSRAPHLTMDMAMHHIDLDLLTRAYSFGSIQGRIDIEVSELELVNWQPVRFDARLISSPGDYKRRISQAAIENLTALGGASAVTAIQKSFLSFFEQFRYSRIGWRCKLRNNICQMGGIEPLPDNEQGYVLVKGSGVPAITITGYNREVDWPELIKRLENAIKSGNPIIH
jgi:hypothetical protein